ncbi:MAG: hypothetical protein J0I14_09880 [Propionibacteriaceae bacterium]|jgi:hypothetical protein|nr:hypothetical protein [Propionibacteriaceae bacterium]
MTAAVALYGLSVESELPLYQDRPVLDRTAPTLEVRLGPPVAATTEPPEGRVLLNLIGDRQYYTGSASTDGYRLRFYGTCDVKVDPTLARATVHPVGGVDAAVLSVLVSGTLLAFVLGLRGAPVLHASAVQLPTGALAIAGASGMGKSTLATLLCAGGARLITDDLLRLDLSAAPPTCALGSTELRLRRSAAELARLFETPPTSRPTGDARAALAVHAATQEGVPLRAIVIPLPERSGERRHASVQRLDEKSALLLMMRFPRLLGWSDPQVIERQFQQLGELVASVPVYLAQLPWGPPFPAGLADELLAATGLAEPS